MFNKLLFDKNAFDRSVSSETMSVAILASGKVLYHLQLVSPLPLTTAQGSGTLSPGLILRRNVGAALRGGGDIPPTEMIFRRASSANLSASGNLGIPGIAVKTPMSMSFAGEGFAGTDDRVLMIHHLNLGIAGMGEIKGDYVVETPIKFVEIKGGSAVTGRVALQIPLTFNMSGASKFDLRRVRALNESVFELIGIELRPGETVTIDTDLLQVLFGSREDVSSVSTDSTFFELTPGENDITILTNIESELDITAIWQNRWL